MTAVVVDERDLLLIGLAVAFLPLAAGLFVFPARPRIHASYRAEPARLVAGAPGAVRLQLAAGASRVGLIDVEQPPVPGLLAPTRRVIAPMRPGQRRETVFRVRTARRGRYRVGPPVLRVGDPLGLWERIVTPAAAAATRAEVIVVPPVVPLADLPRTATGHAAGGGGSASGALSSDPDVGVRPYRVGDDIRTIHWRASARLEDDLVVRTTHAASLGVATLLLDDRRAGYGRRPGAGLDTAACLTASIGLHLLAQDVSLTLLDHASRPLAAGHDVADEILVALAGAGLAPANAAGPEPGHEPGRDVPHDVPHDGAASSAFRPTVRGRPDLLVAVVGALRPVEVAALVAARPGGVTAVALVVGGLGTAEGRGAGAVAGALAAAGWRAAVVDPVVAAPRPGAIDTTAIELAWRTACAAGTGRVPATGVEAVTR